MNVLISGRKRILFSIFIIVFGISCQGPSTQTQQPKEEKAVIVVPAFNADSALAFVKAQTDFGPRVPGSQAHSKCSSWLISKISAYTENVTVQDFKGRVYNGDVFNCKNIIASFNPERKGRIMLCSHWDSRPFADKDPDPASRNQPVMGANDGASGVGVLLELARLLKAQNPTAGVDIVFFDLEDYGPPHDQQQDEGSNEHWGLGSQYWSRNPHLPDYRARFAILLDMVGLKDARFLQEGFSVYFAPDKVKKVWDIADELGYSSYFSKEKGGYINDDHYFINEIRKMPAIDIIHLDNNSSNGTFFEYWHTTGDTFDKIDRQTLKVVGEVVTKVVYEER